MFGSDSSQLASRPASGSAFPRCRGCRYVSRCQKRVTSCSAVHDTESKPLSQTPWTITFDLRERETLWTEENQARLVRIVASHELAMDVDEVERRLLQLLTILPSLSSKLAYIKPSLLAGLVKDPADVLDKLVQLRDIFPEADVEKIVVAQPELLLKEIHAVRSEVNQLRGLLGVDDIDRAIEENPRLLDAEAVDEVLEELRRLMPQHNPVQLLLQDPSWLLRVERGAKRLGQSPDEPC